MKDLPEQSIGREFRIGEPRAGRVSEWPREILVLFDSAGNAAMITDKTRNYTGSGLFAGMEAVTVSMPPFTPKQFGTRSRIQLDTVKVRESIAEMDVAKASLNSVRDNRPLTDQEFAQAKALAAWLWERRCFK